MELTGFKAFDFSEGWPYLSITKNGLTFSKGVTLKLGSPEYVRFLINPETKQVAIQTCEKNTPRATTFYRPRKNGTLSVRWNTHDLISTLERMLETSFENHSFRIDGEILDDHTMLFDLNNAKELS